MLKLFVTDDAFPPSPKTLQTATDAGAEMVAHLGDPGAMGLPLGYHEVVQRGDSIEDKRADMLAQLASNRWRASQAVVCAALGAPFTVPCDLAAGVNVTGALVSMTLPGGPASRKWKCGPDDWRAFGVQELTTLGQAMAAHVQACFDHENGLADQIARAQDAGAIASIDIESGWPA